MTDYSTNAHTPEEVRLIRLAHVCRIAMERELNITFADRYVEPGYTSESGVIAFADWNSVRCEDITPENRREPQNITARIGKLIEALDGATEWSDEWTACECGGAVRTQPDSHCWKPSFVMGDGEILCRDCAEEDAADYVDSFLLNNTNRADTFDINLETLGFEPAEEGEHGFHPGQNDQPADMIENVPDGYDFAFQLESVGQFDCSFSMWIRPRNDYGYRIRRDFLQGRYVVESWDDRTEDKHAVSMVLSDLRKRVKELRAYDYHPMTKDVSRDYVGS